MNQINRREFIGAATLAGAGLLLGCSDSTAPTIPVEPGGRLTVQPHANTSVAAPGLQPIGLGGARDGQIFIPTVPAGTAVPLLVLLHGAGGSNTMWFGSYANRAQTAGMALLAPDSRATITWDRLGRNEAYSGDVVFINDALGRVFDIFPIDPARIYVAGFSDGASYALSIGLTNGDLFSKVIAYSPGLLEGVDRHGSPKVMISHGVNDDVISIDRGGRRITDILRANGYVVSYGEFNGGHEVPSVVSDAAFEFLAT